MSSDTNDLLININGNISNATKRIEALENSTLAINRYLIDVIKNQQTQIDLLQKLFDSTSLQSNTIEDSGSSET